MSTEPSNQILSLLGKPDFVFTHSKSGKPLGFEYGDAEFYFVSHKDDRLRAIYFDEFTIPKGNKLLQIDVNFLRASMSQIEMEKSLSRLNIRFESAKMPAPSMSGIVTQGGVTLGFINESNEFSPPTGLYNIAREISI